MASEETRIALLEQSQTAMSKEISEIKKIVSGFDEKLDRALDKKANKWVERVLIWAGVTVGASILTYVVSSIIKYNSFQVTQSGYVQGYGEISKDK